MSILETKKAEVLENLNDAIETIFFSDEHLSITDALQVEEIFANRNNGYADLLEECKEAVKRLISEFTVGGYSEAEEILNKTNKDFDKNNIEKEAIIYIQDEYSENLNFNELEGALIELDDYTELEEKKDYIISERDLNGLVFKHVSKCLNDFNDNLDNRLENDLGSSVPPMADFVLCATQMTEFLVDCANVHNLDKTALVNKVKEQVLEREIIFNYREALHDEKEAHEFNYNKGWLACDVVCQSLYSQSIIPTALNIYREFKEHDLYERLENNLDKWAEDILDYFEEITLYENSKEVPFEEIEIID